MRRDGAIAGFGELLIRLSAPRGERLLQSPRLEVSIGGAEANVLVSLAVLGHATRMVSLLPGNDLGRAAAGEIARYGVDVSQLVWASGRMGTYFITPGAGARGAETIYDRAGSVFAAAAADAVDWDAALKGAGWLHLSGVTPAIGPACAAAALRAARAARAAGLTVSFDGNFRKTLWDAWDGDPAALLKPIFAEADLAFADHRDFSLVLGQTLPSPQAAAKAAFAAFPNLKMIAGTRRIAGSADQQTLGALLQTREGRLEAEPRALTGIVDRIGGGDAFAAGLIHGLRKGWADAASLDFALAAAVLKHSTWGDFNLAREDEIQRLVQGGDADVRR